MAPIHKLKKAWNITFQVEEGFLKTRNQVKYFILLQIFMKEKPNGANRNLLHLKVKGKRFQDKGGRIPAVNYNVRMKSFLLLIVSTEK